jgi:rhodanese-related sulfurtransferase
MALTLAVVCVGVLGLLAVVWIKRAREDRHEIEEHCITPEDLHALMASQQGVLLFDVRQPLDLLANSEIIPGAKRIPPEDVLKNPELIPKDKDSVVYCTCPSDKTSRLISKRAHVLNFLKIRFLKGGLAAWKAQGYPVEHYNESFRLYTGA